MSDPTVTEPPVTEPLVTEPPVTEPPTTEPTVTEPTVTEPLVTEPLVTEPTTTEPTTTPSTVTSTIEVVITPSSPFSLEDLLNAHQVILAKENVDRVDANAFMNMSIDSIKPQLYAWAVAGCPSLYQVTSLTLNPPGTCSDGVSRSHLDYFMYLTGNTIAQWLDSMDAKTTGMKFTYSHDGYSHIYLHVNKSG